MLLLEHARSGWLLLYVEESVYMFLLGISPLSALPRWLFRFGGSAFYNTWKACNFVCWISWHFPSHMSLLTFCNRLLEYTFQKKGLFTSCTGNLNIFLYQTYRIHQRWNSSANMAMPTDTKFRKSLAKEVMGLFVQLLTDIPVRR